MSEKKVKEITLKTVPQKKKKGKEKKPTLSLGGVYGEKPKVKEIKPKRKRENTVKKETAQAPVAQTVASKRSERKIKVTFVCTGNTCRSAMMQYLFADYLKSIGGEDEFEIAGAGLAAQDGDDMSEYAKTALNELGITEIAHWARSLTVKLVNDSDLIVCMTESHKSRIGGEKTVTVASLTGGSDVSDPFGGTLDDYRFTAAQLKAACPYVYEAAKKRL